MTDTIDTLRAQLAKLSAENEQLREQRNRIGLYIDRALNGGKKDDHEAGLGGRMDAIRALRAQLAEAQRDAARYRTLRSLWFQFGTMANIRTEPGISLHRINMAGDLHTLDVAIDAAKGEPS